MLNSEPHTFALRMSARAGATVISGAYMILSGESRSNATRMSNTQRIAQAAGRQTGMRVPLRVYYTGVALGEAVAYTQCSAYLLSSLIARDTRSVCPSG